MEESIKQEFAYEKQNIIAKEDEFIGIDNGIHTSFLQGICSLSHYYHVNRTPSLCHAIKP